jgi:integrase/recombinase XerC
MSWSESVAQYLDTLSSARTRVRYAAAFDEFAEWYQGTYGEVPTVSEITALELREWRAYLLNVRRLMATSINLRLSALKMLLRSQDRELHVEGVRVTPRPVAVVTARQFGKLLGVLEGKTLLARRDMAIAQLMYGAGLRVGEVVELRLADVEIRDKSGRVLIRQGKGLKERTVPVGVEVRRALRDYLELRPAGATEVLFVSRTGKPIHARDVERAIAEAARQAGLEQEVTPHTLRHSFATRFVQTHGGDVASLAAILGHQHVVTTTRYLHPNQAQLQEMMEGM